MTDKITLRRAAEQARSALNGWANHGLWAWPESALQTCKQNTEEALAALDAALAEPEKGNCADGSCNCCWNDKPEPDAKREADEDVIVASFRCDLGEWPDGSLDDYIYGWREAELFHGIRKEDKV